MQAGRPAPAIPPAHRFSEDVVARKLLVRLLRSRTAVIQEDDGWQQNWMPVANLFVGSEDPCVCCLSREKKHHKHCKKHHVAGKTEEQRIGCDAAVRADLCAHSASHRRHLAHRRRWAVGQREACRQFQVLPFRFRRGVRKVAGMRCPLGIRPL